jgi:hypothetical protein
VFRHPDTNTGRHAYQTLYATQQKYDKALYMYNTWIIENNQEQVDIKTANLEVIKAKLADDQNLMAYLAGEQVPADASGAALSQIRQAELNVRLAESVLNTRRRLTVHASRPGSSSPATSSRVNSCRRAAISMAQLEIPPSLSTSPRPLRGAQPQPIRRPHLDSFPVELLTPGSSISLTRRNSCATYRPLSRTHIRCQLEVQDPVENSARHACRCYFPSQL